MSRVSNRVPAPVAAAVVVFIVALNARAGVMTVTPSADGKQVDVRLPAVDERQASRLVELVDGAGNVVRTLAAGRARQPEELTLTPKLGVPPGTYTLRYRHGLDLQFVGTLEHPNAPAEKWLNPVDIAFTADATYVMETSFAPSGTVAPTVPGPRITKLTADGKLDTAFGKGGRLQIGNDHPGRPRTFCLAPDGQIYIGDTYHSQLVFDAGGQRLLRRVGGWDNKPNDPLCTGYASSIALGPGSRIYIPTGYGNMKVYDRTKPGFDGALSMTKIDGVGLERATAVSESGDLYLIGARNTITRYRWEPAGDAGGRLAAVHATEPPAGLAAASGPWVGGDQLWLVDHGPSPGPFWDSGGGGEVLLFWDDGTGCRFIQRFGRLGSADDAAEFFSPACVVVSRDHRELWVVEDGATYAEGPSGAARIRRFRITATVTEELPLDLGAWAR